MKTACIACLLLIVALCSLTGEPLSLAIMGVEPIGTDRETAQILEELLLSSLAGRNIFTLVERERVDALLAEMELQVSGFTDASSVAEIGNLLNVQKVLFGSIGRYDAEYVEYLVSLRIVDVERGAIDVAGTFQVASKAVLKDSVEAMVSELIRGIKFAGKVMKSDPSGIYTDLGTDAGVVEGTRLSVSRYDEVKDDAGKVIMREEIPVANLAAESVSKEGSRARFLSIRFPPKPGFSWTAISWG